MQPAAAQLVAPCRTGAQTLQGPAACSRCRHADSTSWQLHSLWKQMQTYRQHRAGGLQAGFSGRYGPGEVLPAEAAGATQRAKVAPCVKVTLRPRPGCWLALSAAFMRADILLFFFWLAASWSAKSSAFWKKRMACSTAVGLRVSKPGCLSTVMTALTERQAHLQTSPCSRALTPQALHRKWSAAQTSSSACSSPDHQSLDT